MNEANPKRDDSWYKAKDLLAAAPKSSSVGLMIVLRRGRGRRPNEAKTTALFQDIAARVNAATRETPQLLQPFASMQSCLVEGSVRWVAKMLEQPEIGSVVLNGFSAPQSNGRKGIPGKTAATWCSGLMPH